MMIIEKICKYIVGKKIAIMISNNDILKKICNILNSNSIIILNYQDRDNCRRLVLNQNIDVILYDKANIRLAKEIFWSKEAIKEIICVDSYNSNEVPEPENPFMNKELWELVGLKSKDDIDSGGWKNSYNGEKFSQQEMEEFSENVYSKLMPLINKNSRALEIGCASGLTMFKIAPKVSHYCATDISEVIIEKNKNKIIVNGLDNITLYNYPAHELENILEYNFDIFIINSVIQCFNGYNYLENIIRKLISKASDKAIFFFGDIMDLDTKDDLLSSLKEYSKINNTPMICNLCNELFLPKRFFYSLPYRFDGFTSVECTPKIHTIDNELTRFRYDAIAYYNKTVKVKKFERKLLDCSNFNI